MKLDYIHWFKKDELADDVTGYFPLPTLYINTSKNNFFGIKVYFIGIIWLRYARTTAVCFKLDKKENN